MLIHAQILSYTSYLAYVKCVIVLSIVKDKERERESKREREKDEKLRAVGGANLEGPK